MRAWLATSSDVAHLQEPDETIATSRKLVSIFNFFSVSAGAASAISILSGKPFWFVYVCVMSFFIAVYGMFRVLKHRYQYVFDQVFSPEEWEEYDDVAKSVIERSALTMGVCIGLACLVSVLLTTVFDLSPQWIWPAGAIGYLASLPLTARERKQNCRLTQELSDRIEQSGNVDQHKGQS